jgi:hypothetical protein
MQWCRRRPGGGRLRDVGDATWFSGIGRSRHRGRPFQPANGNPANSCSIDFAGRIIDGNKRMKFLSYAYRFASNFTFLSLVYFSLNFMEKYQHRAIIAILVLVYAAMRSATAFRSFYFYQKIERLEVEARRLAALTGDGPSASAQRKQIVNDVAGLRRTGEMHAYIDLLFLSLVMVLCISKIVAN